MPTLHAHPSPFHALKPHCILEVRFTLTFASGTTNIKDKKVQRENALQFACLLVTSTNRFQAIQKLGHFIVDQRFQLAVAHAVPIHNDATGHVFIAAVPSPQGS